MDNNKEELDKLEQSLDLMEYKLSERIQSRIISRAKVYATFFGICLSLLGLFGGSLILDYISNKTENRIQAQMARETNALRNRLSEDLADLKVATAEFRKISVESRKKLDELQDNHTKLKDLKSQYDSLYSEIINISDRVSDATEIIKDVEKDSESLRMAIMDQVSGNPLITGFSFDWESHGYISGNNFGKSIKPLYLTVEATTDDKDIKISSSLIHIKPDAITSWNDKQIDFQVSKDLLDSIKSEQNKVLGSLPSNKTKSLNALFTIKTEKGAFSGPKNIFRELSIVEDNSRNK